ncbi:OmpP1/FadL family transporter [Hydrogenimonas sp.]
MKESYLLSRTMVAVTLCALGAVTAQASAYKIPEQSTRSMALSAAYVAGADSADASYFNPANMSWVEGNALLEAGLTYIHLPKVEFRGTVAGTPADADSKTEDFLLPYFHYISPKVDRWRFGLSLTEPGGLSKKWYNDVQKMKAEEFSLKVIELNPTISYEISPELSVGAGIRGLYSDGKVKAYLANAYAENMTGDTFEVGYNLAISYRPQPETTLSVTYRSNVDLDLEGSATGFIAVGSPQLPYYDTNGGVSVPLPATLVLAAAHTFGDTRVEVLYERTYWSAYEKLDFHFDDATVDALFGAPIDKNWSDTNTFRIGVTHRYDEKWTLMAGYAYDETPIPEATLGFELPDADAHVFSAGAIMQVDEAFEVGFSILYDHKQERTIHAPPNENGINGTFKKGGAILTNVSIGYRF